MARFFKVNIEIANICNLACSFCPEVVRAKGMMSPALFRQVVEQVAPLTEQVCLHLMGDPLVHPKLSELVAICKEHRAQIFLVTNGVLLRPQQAELLLDPAFRQVSFSLHSFHDNFQDRDPRPYLERIFRFTEEALLRRPDLYVNYRLWNLEGALGRDKKNVHLLDRIEERFGVPLRREVDVRDRKSHRVKGRLYLHYDTEFMWPSLDLPILGDSGHCHGLSTHFGVLVDGTVVPCCLDKEGSIPLGNLQETPVLQILGSRRAQKMLKGFHDGKLLEPLCQRCQYIERFEKPSE